MRRHPRNLCGDRFVLPDWRAPLHAFACPLLSDLQHPPPARRTPGRNREAACVESDQRELQPEAFAPQEVFLGDEDVFETDQYIADAAQSHELAAMDDLDSRRVHLEDEGRDLLFLFALDDLGRGTRHHDDHFRFEAVRAPQLFAVEDPSLSIRRRNGVGLHLGRIATDSRLGQRERGDRALG